MAAVARALSLGCAKPAKSSVFWKAERFFEIPDEARVKRVVAMSMGFCRLFDWLQRDPFEKLRNVPLQKGEPVREVGGLYSCQESVDGINPPKFTEVPSVNYEAAAA